MSEKKLSIEEMYEARPKSLLIRILVFVIILALVIWSKAGINFSGVAAKGSDIAWGTIYGITHPDSTLLFDMAAGYQISYFLYVSFSALASVYETS